MIINVTIEDRSDGGVSVYSEDLAGLVLSGKDRLSIIKAIEPAARAILEHKGQDTSNIRIDATFVKAPAPIPWDAYHNRSYEPVEKLAKEIYDFFEYKEAGPKPPWVPGGNSSMQDAARVAARQQLRNAAVS